MKSGVSVFTGNPLRRRRGFVLVVDDDPPAARMYIRMLRPMTVQVAYSVEAAIAMLEDGLECDAIICDVLMPNSTGEDLLLWIARARPTLLARLIFVSGSVRVPSRIRNHHTAFTKPVPIGVLRRAVVEAMGSDEAA